MKKISLSILALAISATIINAQTVTTLAGSGYAGSNNGQSTSASFNHPTRTAIDQNGNVFVADYYNHMIRKITPAGAVTTFAGSTTPGFLDGSGSNARFNYPGGITIDKTGNLYVADAGNNTIRKITPAGMVTTIAGSGLAGSSNDTGLAARFNYPLAITIDNNSNLYVVDYTNNMIRKISPSRVVTTLAGTGLAGSNNGAGVTASFYKPYGIAADTSGNVYVADSWNQLIRKISPAGNVTTFAGSGVAGAADGASATASFNYPLDVTVDQNNNVYVADQENNMIRKITPNGTVTTYAGTGVIGSANGPVNLATFYYPGGVSVDTNNNVYVTDCWNHDIRKITPKTNDVNNTVAGGNSSYIYPVPTEGTLHLKTRTAMENGTIKIMNAGGQILRTENNLSGNYFTFDITNLANGTYFVQIEQNGTIEYKNIVKNR